MKTPLFLIFAAPTIAQAALIAEVTTTRGIIAVELQYDKAPQAVGNFITLALGSRPRLDSVSGAITNTPLYVGEKFFRVVNDSTFKIAQTGSGTGTNSGGPGFTFKDEFHPSLAHVPYVLSMANSGPNTNGSQIFFTGNVTIPSLNNVHTVFGIVTDASSRAVIDAIHTAGSAGSNVTTITSINFTRTDPAAIAFNEHGQNLPTITQPSGSLSISRNVAATWNLNPPIGTGSIFRAFRSTTLNNDWAELPSARQQVGIGHATENPTLIDAPLDNAAAARAFYHLSVTSHPGAVAPSHFRGRTVTIPLSGGILTLAFTSTGNVGTTTFTPTSGSSISSTLELLDFRSGAHDVSIVTDSPQLNPRYLLFKLGCDSATSTLIACRHKTEYFNSPLGWQPFASGNATITR